MSTEHTPPLSVTVQPVVLSSSNLTNVTSESAGGVTEYSMLPPTYALLVYHSLSVLPFVSTALIVRVVGSGAPYSSHFL